MGSIQYKHFAEYKGNRRVEFQDPETFWKDMERHRGKKIWIAIGRFVAKRTIPANNYYWAVVVEAFVDRWGYEPEEVHEILKEMFCREADQEDGRPGRILSTAKMNKDEFWEYIEKIRRYAAIEWELVIPDPKRLVFDAEEERIRSNPGSNSITAEG